MYFSRIFHALLRKAALTPSRTFWNAVPRQLLQLVQANDRRSQDALEVGHTLLGAVELEVAVDFVALVLLLSVEDVNYVELLRQLCLLLPAFGRIVLLEQRLEHNYNMLEAASLLHKVTITALSPRRTH